MTNDREPSLWELLGLDPQTTVPPLSDDAWGRAVQIATDPDTPPVGADLIPSDDPDELDLDPVTAEAGLDVHDVPDHHDPDLTDPALDDPALDDPALDDPTLGEDVPGDDDLSPGPGDHDLDLPDDPGLG